MSKSRGFTLIELLVTISIIAILSTIGMTVYGQVTQKARDARRKLDLQNIAQALEVYYQKNGRYPIYSWVYSTSANWIPDLIRDSNGISYMSSLPQDPKSNGGTPWVDNSFGYAYWSDRTTIYGCPSVPDGQFYILVTQLENHSDSDRLEVKDNKFCDGNGMYSSSHWSKYSYVITPNQ